MKIMIHGSSMEPTLYEGEFYKVVPRGKYNIKIGDIVVAKIEGQYVVKRVTGICQTIFGTPLYDLKGDNFGRSRNFTNIRRSQIQYIVTGPALVTRILRRWRRACFTQAKEKEV